MNPVSVVLAIIFLSFASAVAQDAGQDAVDRGSRTAKDGFQNEDDIRDRFNSWQSDSNAQAWLKAMGHDVSRIQSVRAEKPHGEKADVEVTVKAQTADGGSAERVERISIKLVSTATGFNQIDKRWLAAYAEKWRMPQEVVSALKLFVGESPPVKGSRTEGRMYLNELPESTQQAVLTFFTKKKDEIISDLLAGAGEHSANWMMVTLKGDRKARWVIRSMKDTVRCFGDGPVEMTKAGNLKIGHITMQRKGGDNGRETAKMLQFKVNPVLLFDAE
ncbi:MAG: hypothetical protein R3C49_17785 [Planctomycetaceae bacterium]